MYVIKLLSPHAGQGRFRGLMTADIKIILCDLINNSGLEVNRLIWDLKNWVSVECKLVDLGDQLGLGSMFYVREKLRDYY